MPISSQTAHAARFAITKRAAVPDEVRATVRDAVKLVIKSAPLSLEALMLRVAGANLVSVTPKSPNIDGFGD